MRKIFVFILIMTATSAGWTADNEFQLLGKWVLETMFCQNFILLPNTGIGREVHPFISMLIPKGSDSLITRIDSIEFIDDELTLIVTSKGTTKAFYSIGMSDFALGASITFKFPNLSLFPISDVILHCFSPDGKVLRFSYLSYFRSSFSPNMIFEFNFLGEMRRQ